MFLVCNLIIHDFNMNIDDIEKEYHNYEEKIYCRW